MTFKMMGKKEGMTQRFDETGNVVACTLISVEPHVVVSIRKKDKEGYDALQLGFEKLSAKDSRTIENRLTKPLFGHFKKANCAPCRYLSEAVVDNIDQYSVGQELNVTLYADVSHVDVTACSKGKGFQGVIKRHGFAGGPGAHGSSFHRHGGSTGMRSTPGRGLPGVKKAGRMGNEMVTVQNLKVLGVDEKRALLVVEGAIPGATGSLVYFSPSPKKAAKKKEKK